MAGSDFLVIELFGKLADPCGRSVTIAIPGEGCSGAELRARLARHDPALGALLASTRVRLCINDNLALAEDRIRPGDSVAILPPVSGG